MTKNEKRVIAVDAIILVVFLVISFVAPFKMNGVFWLSVILGVISIAAQLYILKSAFGQGEGPMSKFYGFPIAKIGFVYMVAQLILSLVFMAIGSFCPTWIPVIVFVVILGAACIGFIAADATRDEIECQDAVLKTNTECMQTLRSIVYPLAGQVSDQDCVKALQELADEFRYSDPVSGESIKDIEKELTALVEKLQKAVVDDDKNSIEELCRKTNVVLTERNRMCKLKKRK